MNKDTRTLVRRSILLLGLLVLIAMAVMATTGQLASASPLDQEALLSRATAAAQRAGLKGEPTSQTTLRTTLGEWLKTINVGLDSGVINSGLTPEKEVLVVAMRGEVVQNIPGLPEPGKPYPNKYSNITIALSVDSGEVLWVGMYNDEKSMPLAVP